MSKPSPPKHHYKRWLPLSLLLQPTHALYMHRIPRPEYTKAPAMFEDEPVIVEEALSLPKCTKWRDHILTRSRSELVRVREDDTSPTTTKLPLAQALEWATEKSTHWTPLYLSSMGSSCSTDQLPMYDLLEELFDTNPYDDTTDWLAYLGRHASIHDTLVVAGEGATSATIRSHPFTKTYLCLEGSQLLRVVPPRKWDWEQEARPHWGRAWNEFPVSMGMQLSPDLNLFTFRHREVDEGEPYETYDEYAEDPNLLHPNFAMPHLEDCDRLQHDLWHSTVLLPGDLAVIPPGWWYQTYNLEDCPSIGIYSQRCGGSVMGAGMVKHMLESAFGPRNNSRLKLVPHEGEDYYYTKDEAQALVDKLFDVLEDYYEDDAGGDTARPRKKTQEER